MPLLPHPETSQYPLIKLHSERPVRFAPGGRGSAEGKEGMLQGGAGGGGGVDVGERGFEEGFGEGVVGV